MNNKPYTQIEFINKVYSVNPNIEVLGDYTTSHSRILVRCKKCCKEWSPLAYHLIQGSGCPECGKILAINNRKGKNAKKTHEQFVQEVRKVNRSITVVSEYTGNRNKIDCVCNVCGNKWSVIPYSILNGIGCPECAKRKRMSYRRYTPESFEEKVAKVNDDVELLSKFTKSTDRIRVRCKKCGNVWQPKAFSLIQGKGCPKCAHINGAKNNIGKTGLKTREIFVEQLSKVDNSIEVISEYVNTHTNIKCKCFRCGHIWDAKPYSLLQGHGCPRCAKSGTSFMEQLILLCFREAVGDNEVLSRDKSLIGMELDIIIPKYKVAIEPGNWFLHQRSIKRDERKRQLCENKGFRLITIYDKYPENKKTPFFDNCFVFSDDLNKADHSIIRSLIYALFNECNIIKQFKSNEWEKLEGLAYENSKALTHEEFVKRLFAIRPDIKVIGKYRNANRRIEVKCKKCGYSWYGVPANLLVGDGCRKCGAKVRGEKERRKQEDFEEELRVLIPSVKVIGEYKSRHKPIRVRCLKCKTVWDTTPGSLLRKDRKKDNNGCPTCAKQKRGTTRKRVINIDTGEEFASAVEAGYKYDIVPSAIRQCCRGKSKTAKGYHWKYL